MVFEVDNTTEQLIEQLQESIQSTIYTLEEGQREIKELIDEVKESNNRLATAAQTDLVSEDISKVRAAIQKLAIGDQLRLLDATQEKILGIAEQETKTVAEIKSTLPEMSSSIEKYARTIMEHHSDGTKRLESLITGISTSVAEAKIEQLQVIAKNMDILSQNIGSRMDKLSSETSAVIAVAEHNKIVLSSIAAYLSMPGYKRFFKGMEVPNDEITE